MLWGALVAAVVLVTGCSGTASELAGEYWLEGVTPQAVAEHLQIELPATATDARAAHRRGHDDKLLLSFVLPTGDVDGFFAGLRSEQPLWTATPFSGAAGEFERLGLPEPVSAPGARRAQVCAPCIQRDLDFLQLAVTQVDGTSSRVYIRAFD